MSRPALRGPRRPALIPALPRPAWVVLGGDFLSAIGSGLTLPCLFVYAHQVRHLGDSTSGLVVAAIALASVAGNPLGGALADRLTARRAVMAGLVVSAAGSVALALARSVPELFGAACLFGLGVSVTWPAQDALLSSVAGPVGRSAVFSVRHTSYNAGMGIGALVAASVVSVAHPGTFTAVYLADAASYLAFIPVLARLRQQERAGVPPEAAPPPGSFRQVLRDKAFRRVWVLLAVILHHPAGSSRRAEVTVALAISQLMTGQIAGPVRIGTIRRGCDNHTGCPGGSSKEPTWSSTRRLPGRLQLAARRLQPGLTTVTLRRAQRHSRIRSGGAMDAGPGHSMLPGWVRRWGWCRRR